MEEQCVISVYRPWIWNLNPKPGTKLLELIIYCVQLPVQNVFHSKNVCWKSFVSDYNSYRVIISSFSLWLHKILYISYYSLARHTIIFITEWHRVFYIVKMSSIKACLGLYLLVLVVFGSNIPGHKKPLGHHRSPEDPIHHLNYFPEPLEFYEKFVIQSKAVIFKDVCKDFPANRRWTDNFLRWGR